MYLAIFGDINEGKHLSLVYGATSISVPVLEKLCFILSLRIEYWCSSMDVFVHDTAVDTAMDER